jgi:acyl-CoA thioester hydrolase
MSKQISAELEIKVPFYDIDPMNVVWHGHYAKYFEAARCEVLDVIGYGYQEMKDSGYSWPVIDMRLRYIKPALLGQSIRCRATIVEYENRLKIDYEIHCAKTGSILTRGTSVQVAVDLKNREMQLVSPKILFIKMEQADAQT